MFYTERINAAKANKLASHLSFAAFIYDYLAKKYGKGKLTDSKFGAIVYGVLKHGQT
jgi:hypothetical protein